MPSPHSIIRQGQRLRVRSRPCSTLHWLQLYACNYRFRYDLLHRRNQQALRTTPVRSRKERSTQANEQNLSPILLEWIMRQLGIILTAYAALCACAATAAASSAAASAALHDGVSTSAATTESGYCRILECWHILRRRKQHSATTAVHPVATVAAISVPTAQKFIPLHTRSATWHHILHATQACSRVR